MKILLKIYHLLIMIKLNINNIKAKIDLKYLLDIMILMKKINIKKYIQQKK